MNRQQKIETKSGALKGALGELARKGRHGDTMLAHISKDEAALLKSLGGSGTINPHTGLPEYFGLGSLNPVKVVKKVAAPVVDVAKQVVSPVVDVTKQVVSPLANVAKQVVSPVVDVTKSVASPAADIFEKVLSPAAKVVENFGKSALSTLKNTTEDVKDFIGDAYMKVRDPLETAAVVAGNYILPGSAIITSKLVSDKSKEQLNSDLGRLAVIGSGVSGGMQGNMSNYGMGQGAAASSVPADQLAMANATQDPIAALNASQGWTMSDVDYLKSIGASESLIAAAQANNATLASAAKDAVLPAEKSTLESLKSGLSAVGTGLSYVPTAMGALALLNMVKGGQPEAEAAPVNTMSDSQKEYFNRPVQKWDWDQLKKEAHSNGQDLGTYLATHWNDVSGGAFNKDTGDVIKSEVKPAYARGGSVLNMLAQGGGSGRDDTINAKLSDGEYVMDAETVAMLGDGSTKAGAQRLDHMRSALRAHKGKKLAKGEISPNAKSPLAYLKEAK